MAHAVATEPCLMLETIGDVATLTLNRPGSLNSLSTELLAALIDRFARLASSSARCLVLTGAGRGFCSGAELGTDSAAGADLGIAVEQYFSPLIEGLLALPMPIVTCVNGIAAGAGCALALAGDIVIASEQASFLMAFVNIGLVPDAGASWLLPAAVGRARALEMMMLGERLPAATALAWGLVNRVVPAAELAQTGAAMARRLAAMPTRALALIRRNVDGAINHGLAHALLLERDGQREAGGTADFAEGVAAFRVKRPPVFTGR